MFSNIIISSPNGGGLFCINDSKVYHLDNINTTGLFFSSGHILRGLQPGAVQALGSEVLTILGKEINFHDIHDVLFFENHYYLVSTNGNEILKIDLKGNVD